MFFYTEINPTVNDYVAVRVKAIKEFGYICELPEYDDKLAYLNINDITTEKIRKIQDLKRHLKLNTIEVLEIKEIDASGNINLNKKYLDDESVKLHLDKFTMYDKIYNFLSNNRQVQEIDKSKILDELKDYKSKEINFTDLSEKYPVLSNLKIKVIIVEETDNHTFEFTDYVNVNTLKENLEKIKNKYRVIESITIINLKSGKFNIKTTDKCNVEFFENLVKEIREMDYSQNIVGKINIPTETIDSEQPILNIGIIGHVSHGKTTLIQRLTNVDTKKYKKELETNKTLKLGYTNAYITKCLCNENETYINQKCKNLNGNCTTKLISIVDCPGHHVLMNTMLCGTSIMDTSIVMIAANEQCPQPQTIDHLMAITINEQQNNFFENSLVILNKCDLIDKNLVLTRFDEVKDFIKGSIIENCNIIPTSAQKNINLEYVSEWMYRYITEKEGKIKNAIEVNFKSLIVRTFDINKPGTDISKISGLVLGCSILDGTLNIGDEIIILPENIKTTVYELYTDNIPLSSARKGGLIGVKTDLNTVFADNLIGSFFIKAQDFNREYLRDEKSDYTLSYFLRKDISTKKLFREEEIIDVNIQGKFIKNCKIVKVNKSDKTVVVNIPTQTYIVDSLKISFMKNNTLIGYGLFVPQGVNKDKGFQDKSFLQTKEVDKGVSLINKLYNELKIIEKNNKKNIIKLPNPVIIFQNTVSIFQNFIEISNMIDSNHMFLGNYIMNELGLQSMSINEDQLILKGRANETKIENILAKYLLEHKLCRNCLSYETFINKIQNCKMLTCKLCNYSIKTNH